MFPLLPVLNSYQVSCWICRNKMDAFSIHTNIELRNYNRTKLRDILFAQLPGSSKQAEPVLEKIFSWHSLTFIWKLVFEEFNKKFHEMFSLANFTCRLAFLAAVRSELTLSRNNEFYGSKKIWEISLITHFKVLWQRKFRAAIQKNIFLLLKAMFCY